MTNAEQLRVIMTVNNLKADDVADLIDVSLDTVKSWLVHSGAAKYRPMKSRDVDYLQLKIEQNKRIYGNA